MTTGSAAGSRPPRRSLLGGAIAAGLGAPLLSGCAGRALSPPPDQARKRSGETVHLTYWSWLTLQSSVDLWNKQNPGIQVTLQPISGADSGGYQKMYSSLQAGTPPDLAQIEYYQLPAFMLVDGLLDLSAYGADNHKGQFVDWQWEHCNFNGRTRAIPQDSGPMALYYRRDLFEQWGIEVPTTWDEYAEAARAVRKADPSAYIATFPPNNARWFSSLAWQAGARWGGSDGESWTVNLTDERTVRVAEFWESLYRNDLVLTEPDQTNGFYNRLSEGTIVTWVGPQWADSLIRGNASETAGKWDVARMPQWEPGARTSSNWGGSSTAILQGTKHPREAITFATWLNSNQKSVNLLISDAGCGWLAAKDSFDASPRSGPDPFFSNRRYNEQFLEADAHIDNSWRYLPTHLSMESVINDMVGEAVARRTPLRDAFADAERRAIDDMLVKDLPVRGRQ